jgi:UDP:flavonoid glycosyltransferase YjiC (YdhE family)
MSGKSILFSTFGSLGDLFPYFAIGNRLQREGYRVAIASSAHYRQLVERNGFRFHATAPHCDFGDPGFQKRALCEVSGGRFLLRNSIFPQIRASYRDLLKAAEQSDLLVTQTLSYAGPLVAETTGIPWVSTVLSPYTFFSYHDSPVLTPRMSRIRETLPVLNSLVNRAARFTTRRWPEPVRLLRQELGLSPGADPIYEAQHSPRGVLALFSSVLAERQPDWPKQVLITGFPFWEEPGNSAEISDAQEFIQAGSPPVVFTLGSSAVLDPGDFYLESVDAAMLLGCRAILVGWPGKARKLSGSDLLALPYVPHSIAFRGACAVVHAGGIGTAARALQATCPALVVPWAYDQADNAARLVRLGIARMIGKQSYTGMRAAKELDQLLSDARYQKNCRRIADHVQSEDGAEAASAALEDCLRREHRQNLGSRHV